MLVLRAHYTADVFAGIVAALWVAGSADVLAGSFDRALAPLLTALFWGGWLSRRAAFGDISVTLSRRSPG